MRRPGSPVPRLAGGEAREYTSRLDVLAERDVDGARVRRAARPELERAVALYVRVAHDLKRVLILHLSGALDEINRGFGRHFNVRAARDVDRVVATDSVRLARGFYRALARQTDESRLQLARRERGARLAGVETDSTVDEMLHLAVLRRDCDVPPLPSVRAAENPSVV